MRVWLTVLTLALAALIASSCGSTPASTSPSTTPSVATSPSTATAGPSTAPGAGLDPSASPADGGGGGKVIPGLTPPPDLEHASFGSVAFKVDAARKRSVDVPGDGPKATLSVTDQAGLTWTMAIPDGALAAPATIAMTPLAELSSADIRGHLAGGVLLEPDGLQFRIPATLTFSGGPRDGATVLLTGGHDGAGLVLATLLDPTGRSALISHFSTVIGVDEANQAFAKQLDEKTTADATAAVTAALALIKSGDVSVPEPPSIPLECVSTKDAEANADRLVKFTEAVLEPELGLASTLISVANTRELLGGQADDGALIGQLLGRLERKADLLLRTYGSQTEKLQALTAVVLNILGRSDLAGHTQGWDALAQRLAVKWDAMLNRVADSLIRDLVGKHDYRKAEALWRVARQAVFLGSGANGALWDRIEAALRFRLELTLNARWSTNAWLVKAAIPMGYSRDDPAGRFAVGGPKTGEYVALESDILRSVSTKPFDVQASLKILDACAGTAELTIDRFYGDSETYQFTDDENATPPVTLPLLKEAFTHAFEKDLKDGKYVLPVNLHNLDAVMVNTSIERRPPKATGDWSDTLDIVVTHTPGT